MDKNKKKGFTLVELIVVLAILAILAAMLVPALTGYIDKANEKKILATARQYYVASQTVVSEAYANDTYIDKIYKEDGMIKMEIREGRNMSSGTDIVNIEDQEYKWIKDFISLAELNDEYSFYFEIGEDYNIFMSKVTAKGKTAFYANGEWIVYNAPSFG